MGRDRVLLRLAIDFSDGQQARLAPEDLVVGPDGVLNLSEVTDVLSDPCGWIEYRTETYLRPDEEPDDWEEPDEPDYHDATIRIFGRGVTSVMLIWAKESVDAA